MLQNLAVEYEKVADPRLPACSRKAGQLLETCCTILDLKGVGISRVSAVYGYLKQASAMSQNYYPERLGRLYLINAPWGFAGVFSVVKSFLDPVTVQKIHVLGTNYHSELLSQVPAENLPVIFGGTCECEGGCALSDEGPWTDPRWARPPKWMQQDDNAQDAIINKPGDIEEVGQGATDVDSAFEKGEEEDYAAGEPIPATGTTGAVPALGETSKEYA